MAIIAQMFWIVKSDWGMSQVLLYSIVSHYERQVNVPAYQTGEELVGADVEGAPFGPGFAIYVSCYTSIHASIDRRRAGAQVIAAGGKGRITAKRVGTLDAIMGVSPEQGVVSVDSGAGREHIGDTPGMAGDDRVRQKQGDVSALYINTVACAGTDQGVVKQGCGQRRARLTSCSNCSVATTEDDVVDQGWTASFTHQ